MFAQTWELIDGEITTGSIHPTRDFGLATHPISSVRGSTPELNALTFKSILDPASPTPPHLSAPATPDSPSIDSITDYVLLQSAALLKVAGRVDNYKDGVAMARQSMSSGGALKAWAGFARISQEVTASAAGGAGRVEEDGGEAAKGGLVPAWLHAKGEFREQKEKDNK
jgi:anthranilate phosphoribosyltransferase